MKRFTPYRIFAVLLVVVITATSAIPASKAPAPVPVTADRAKAAVDALNKANSDGKLTYHELAAIATELKGEKLTLKEKIGIKLFGKKFATKIMAETGKRDGGKSQVLALILVLLVGDLGIHRFYLGYTWQGIVQLLTLGGCGIWALIDLIRIITGDLKPKDGEYEKTL